MADEASPAEAAEASRQERADRLASEPEPEPEQEPASGGVEMPWDADSIAGASKGEIVGFLQANCSAEFLSKHKLKGQAKAITKKAKAPAEKKAKATPKKAGGVPPILPPPKRWWYPPKGGGKGPEWARKG